MLQDIDQRDRIRLEVPPWTRRRRRGVAVGGEIERGVRAAAGGGGHRADFGLVGQVALDEPDVGEPVPRHEGLEIGRLVIERQDLPLPRRAQQ
jgi:hypothetical protein